MNEALFEHQRQIALFGQWVARHAASVELSEEEQRRLLAAFEEGRVIEMREGGGSLIMHIPLGSRGSEGTSQP